MNDVTRALTRAADTARRARLAAIAHCRTDRRPVPPGPVPADALAAVTRAVSGTGLRVHVLRPDQTVDLAVAADRATSDPYRTLEVRP